VNLFFEERGEGKRKKEREGFFSSRGKIHHSLPSFTIPYNPLQPLTILSALKTKD